MNCAVLLFFDLFPVVMQSCQNLLDMRLNTQ
jgi:hypothetical protein